MLSDRTAGVIKVFVNSLRQLSIGLTDLELMARSALTFIDYSAST